MTLTLELTPDQELRLFEEAARHGVDPHTYALRRLFSDNETRLVESSLADRLESLGIVGGIEGTPRSDGRIRSEIEAPCDSTG